MPNSTSTHPMTNIQSFFNSDNREIRTLMLNDKPMFVAKDIAEALGYKDTDQAIRKHCKKAVNVNINEIDPVKMTGSNMLRHLNLIPESDVYRLIIKSKLPTAEAFEEWVMEEVLPSIRKNGAYVQGQEFIIDNPEKEMFLRKVKAGMDAYNKFADIEDPRGSLNAMVSLVLRCAR
jgi:prophage antirepressor-like protein